MMDAIDKAKEEAREIERRYAARKRAQQDAPTDAAWGLAEKVRADLDRQSCPDAYMRIAVESIVRHYAPAQDAKQAQAAVIPEGWVFNGADFSQQASDPTRPGNVTLVRDVPGRRWWHALSETEIQTMPLHILGFGMTLDEAMADASNAARAQRAAAQGNDHGR